MNDILVFNRFRCAVCGGSLHFTLPVTGVVIGERIAIQGHDDSLLGATQWECENMCTGAIPKAQLKRLVKEMKGQLVAAFLDYSRKLAGVAVD